MAYYDHIVLLTYELGRWKRPGHRDRRFFRR